MPLFDISSIRKPEPEAEGENGVAALHSHGGTRFNMNARSRDLQHVLGTLAKDETVHMVTAGQWSLHQMIGHLLTLTGPADVWLASWSITENPMRQLVQLAEKKVIRSLTVLFDSRTPGQCPEAHQLALANIARIRLTHCHAKAVAILNDEWGISVSTSANLTVNHRIERYVISTHRSVAEFDRDWIERFADDGDELDAAT